MEDSAGAPSSPEFKIAKSSVPSSAALAVSAAAAARPAILNQGGSEIKLAQPAFDDDHDQDQDQDEIQCSQPAKPQEFDYQRHVKNIGNIFSQHLETLESDLQVKTAMELICLNVYQELQSQLAESKVWNPFTRAVDRLCESISESIKKNMFADFPISYNVTNADKYEAVIEIDMRKVGFDMEISIIGDADGHMWSKDSRICVFERHTFARTLIYDAKVPSRQAFYTELTKASAEAIRLFRVKTTQTAARTAKIDVCSKTSLVPWEEASQKVAKFANVQKNLDMYEEESDSTHMEYVWRTLTELPSVPKATSAVPKVPSVAPFAAAAAAAAPGESKLESRVESNDDENDNDDGGMFSRQNGNSISREELSKYRSGLKRPLPEGCEEGKSAKRAKGDSSVPS